MFFVTISIIIISQMTAVLIFISCISITAAKPIIFGGHFVYKGIMALHVGKLSLRKAIKGESVRVENRDCVYYRICIG